MKPYLTDMDVSMIPMELAVKFHIVDKIVASFSDVYSYDFKVWLAENVYVVGYVTIVGINRMGAIGQTLRSNKEC
jgi:hypothetical protein